MIFGKDRRDGDEEEEYMGNIWGWKISMIGLVVILIFGSLFFFRQCSEGEDVFLEKSEYDTGMRAPGNISSPNVTYCGVFR